MVNHGQTPQSGRGPGRGGDRQPLPPGRGDQAGRAEEGPEAADGRRAAARLQGGQKRCVVKDGPEFSKSVNR